MKKGLMIALAVLISVAFVTVTFAQAPAGTVEKKATTTTTTTTTPEKKATTTTTTTTTPEKKETTTTTTTKSKHMEFKGEVVSMDAAAKTLVAKDKKGEMTFDVATAKMKGEAKAGHKVTVKYMEKDGKMVASSVIVKGAKTKTTKKTTTTKEKKEETTTTPAK